MAYKPLIIKSDFDIYVKLGKNVKDNDLDQFIRVVQELDLDSWIPENFYTNLKDNLDTMPQLNALFEDYIKPFLVLGAYYRFLLYHGRNISQYGIRQNNEDTSAEISDEVRAALMADVESQKSGYLNKLKNKMFDDNFTYDGVVYDFYNDCDKKELMNQLNIRQLGARKIIKKGRGFCGYPQD